MPLLPASARANVPRVSVHADASTTPFKPHHCQTTQLVLQRNCSNHRVTTRLHPSSRQEPCSCTARPARSCTQCYTNHRSSPTQALQKQQFHTLHSPKLPVVMPGAHPRNHRDLTRAVLVLRNPCSLLHQQHTVALVLVTGKSMNFETEMRFGW